jgi:ectoine hydroxylase-related dioxygenase (phytanoyl-CoA dioxygenase family)
MNSEFGIQDSESNGFGRLEEDGFQIVNELVGEDVCDLLAAELTPLFERQILTAKGRIGGVRNLLRTNQLVSTFAKSPSITEFLRPAAGGKVFPVRAIFFDKNPGSNWLVPWHQDLAIAVTERIETPGFSGWSVKDGIFHVHPPAEILAGMLTLRLHLDACDAGNGPVKVIPGSHHSGRMPPEDILQRASTAGHFVCEIPKGGALLMRPLLVHASPPADSPHHRRVLHIEYATQKLPGNLEWFDN